MPHTQRLYGFIVLGCAVFLTACGHVNHLREAQDTFNQAAAADNLYRYGDPQPQVTDLNGTNPATDSLSSAAGYAATIAAIEALKKDSEAKKRLQADGLYGYALVLQSLAYWRMEKWDQAVATGREAQATGDLGSRDLALMQALPGLVKNNQAFARLAADATALTCTASPGQSSSYLKWDLKLDDATTLNLHCHPGVIAVRDQLGGALCDVDTARRETPPGHPVRDYLALAQLAAVANIRDMCDTAKYANAPARFSSVCVDETMRAGNCVGGDPYQDDPDALVEAIVKDFCRDRPLEQTGLVWDLVKKSGIDPNQLAAACPKPKP